MAINKVEFGGETLLDLSGDTVTPETMISGTTAHDKAGRSITGTAVIPTKLSELTQDVGHQTVTAAQKATWNAKSDFSGSYNDLSDKPAIPPAYTLPTASAGALGGVKANPATADDTQEVHIDSSGLLKTLKGMQLVRLWKNASPGSSFAGHTVKVPNLSKYKMIAVRHRDGQTDADGGLTVLSGTAGSFATIIYFTGRMKFRGITVRNNAVEFDDAIYKINFENYGEVDNTKLVPLTIYGIRGVE